MEWKVVKGRDNAVCGDVTPGQRSVRFSDKLASRRYGFEGAHCDLDGLVRPQTDFVGATA